ncbi:uncharacterized protein B0H18DRAFT_934574 [Fomitopsis serialis]|uniref:uncharacterized protein n=1 Tax=Fomitopsis serialis TaxID=139415 RepID=UPI0020078BC3|nr:uncharacterized protein B0H18DRAFT_934574 [Neoantrodia serialis]KAH9923817.1 hypothetical protein B0H18DRAFT_934574 [Neoantrodia serialis]
MGIRVSDRDSDARGSSLHGVHHAGWRSSEAWRGDGDLVQDGDDHSEDLDASESQSESDEESGSSASDSHSSPSPKHPKCRGILVHWTPGSVWDTYPFHRHESRTFPWELVGIENTNWLRLRSTDCRRYAHTRNTTQCDPCEKIPRLSEYINFVNRADGDAPKNTPYLYLTHKQLIAKKKISRRDRRINDHQRLTMLLATNDVKRLRELLAVALRNGSSPRYLFSQLQRAISGVYKARGPGGRFDKRDLEIAFLAKALGGPRLLYALNHSHGLPSPSTVNDTYPVPQLLPCIKAPVHHEVSGNIGRLMAPEVKPPAPVYESNKQAGMIAMFDGVAIEEKCRYLAASDSIAGLCREHSADIVTRVTSLEDVEAVNRALHGEDPTCHYGKDATIGAVAPYARTDHYGATPLFASPSCKSEDGADLGLWLGTFLTAWKTHPNGETMHGPIWTVGSDGEASFRKAKFNLCMSESIPHDSELGTHLYRMIGMNTTCGRDGIVATCDPKHVIKRFATLLRNPRGILVHDTCIQSLDVYQHLQDLPSMTPEKARQLLDPVDKQNVPKAVTLMQTLLRLATDAKASSSPSHLHRRRMLIFIARTFAYFTLPFISVGYSLAQQIKSLATYAFLASAMWIRHGTSFMTGALYADSQAIVRNIIITALRLQIVDRNIPFHIILEGTDRLERLFSECRTQDHSRNFDILQLCEKLSVSTLISSIFERNPDLDRGHRRLNLVDALGVDHVNPVSWKGDVIVGHVEVEVEWTRGRLDASALLDEYFGEAARVDFASLFAHSTCDLLRPGPHGKYVGLRHTNDDDRTEGEEEASTDTSIPRDPDPGNAGDATESQSTVLPDSEDFNDVPLGVEIDDFLPDTINATSSGTLPEESPLSHDTTRFIQVGEKRFLKSSVVAAFLTSNRGKKVPMRTLRAQGVTLEDLRNSDKWNLPGLTGENVIRSGDTAATLVCISDSGTICLAVVEIMKFLRQGDSAWLTGVEAAELSQQGSTLTVEVQTLQLIECQQSGSDAWQWTRQYVRSGTKGSDHEQATTKQHTLLVPGFLILPLSPQIVELTRETEADNSGQPNRPHEPQANSDGESSRAQTTWSYIASDLHDALDIAWDALGSESEELMANVAMLPVLETGELPYTSRHDEPQFIVVDLPAHLTVEKKSGSTKVTCFICGESETIAQMRNHVGHHLLYELRDVPDPKPHKIEIGTEPCGWCGRDGECITQLVKKGNSRILHSSCEYHHTKMKYGAASKTNKNTPCTNVPIHCPLCPPTSNGQPRTIWKYNTFIHLLLEHSTPDAIELPSVPPQLLLDMHISRAEEEAMKVDEDATTDYREEFDIPDSDDIQLVREELQVGQKRGRGQSTVVREPRSKATKTA